MNKKSKLLSILMTCTLIIGGLFGCSKSTTTESDNVGSNANSDSKKEITIKVAADLVPHAEILEFVKPKLKEDGINLEIVTFDDSNQLNPALDEKQIDANYFQHVPYLESVSKEKGYKFVVAGNIHVEPIGLYSNKIKNIDEIKEGSKIAITNDPSNEYRALVLLESKGLIKLRKDIEDYNATPKDIVENPKKLEFVEVDSGQLVRVLPDVDGAIINTNRILEAKIDPETALFREDGNSPYGNVVVVREGDENREEIKTLIKHLTTQDVKEFIQEKYRVAVVASF
ncbi:ABC transporter D-methionine-binding protein MetQ [Gottschalkia acidurici 9a]|uniref:Lipoprotein n=1 Tax=Gottschalkia acidurici (strain ATCC 7906 / DSM 604 / BCRC 14475 / CIP 104303 / KCTC 5404 / NCIMB 10678 / 9a) TaxID=1128398 RepID=K0AZD0_GOTA9|nr:MetQ/NlpA family ABC transporter substrate-binding protein [Gottschalkia acidurici]AFS79158.1 ABC transporter D-methionine-binding protein MetQ [Gottschalkia acidurici 9a]